MHIAFAVDNPLPFLDAASKGLFPAPLARGFAALGHRVSVAAPLPAGVDPAARSLARRLKPVEIPLGGETLRSSRYDGRTAEGIDLHLLEIPGLPSAEPGLAERIGRGVAACLKALSEPPELWVSFAPGTVLVPSVARETDAPREQRHLVIIDAAGPDPGTFGAAIGAADAVLVLNRRTDGLASDPCAATLLDMERSGRVAALPWPVEATAATSNDEKRSCKASFQMRSGLPVWPDLPLVVFLDPLSAPFHEALASLLAREVQVAVPADSEALRNLKERYPDRLALAPEATIDALLGPADACVIGHDGRAVSAALASGVLPVAVPGAAAMLIDLEPSLESGSGIVVGDATAVALDAGFGRLLAALQRQEAMRRLSVRLPGFVPTWKTAAARCVELSTPVPQDAHE